jgi:hypothetical protein
MLPPAPENGISGGHRPTNFDIGNGIESFIAELTGGMTRSGLFTVP